MESAPNLADLITLHHIPALPNDEELKICAAHLLITLTSR